MTEKLEAVYELSHILYLPDGEQEDRLIGVYSSKERAIQKQMSLRDNPTFSNARGEFYVSGHNLGEDCWTSGYVTERD